MLGKEHLLEAIALSTLPQPFPLQFTASVPRLGDLLDFGQLFKAFGNN